MARGTRATTRTTLSPKAAARAPAKPKKAAAKAPPKAAPPKTAAERPPVLSKGDLRAQIEKLEQTVATLRARGREANRASKQANARIAELEEEVARLEKQVSSQAAAAKRSATRAAARKSRDIDPGDAMPPGVAVQEPKPLDEEAETVKGNLEEHLVASGEEQGGE